MDTDVGDEILELLAADPPAAGDVECPECHPDGLQVVPRQHPPRHHRAELGELNRAVAVSVELHHTFYLLYTLLLFPRRDSCHLVEQVEDLRLGGVHAHGPHGAAQLLGVDAAALVPVEHLEGLLELGHLLRAQLRLAHAHTSGGRQQRHLSLVRDL